MNKTKNVLHLIACGGVGGIETLVRNYATLSRHHNLFLFAWSGGVNADAIRENGHKVEVIGRENIGYIKTTKYILNLCRKENIDVVIIHNASPLLRIAGGIVKFFHKEIEVVQYAHSNAHIMYSCNNKLKEWLVKEIQRWAFKRADKIIAISRSVKESLIKDFKSPASKIEVINNGVPIEQFSLNKDSKEAHNIVYAGKLTKENGVQTIIKALSFMQKDACLYIVGDGPYREKLEELVCSLNLGKRVIFFGDRKDVNKFLNDASIFVTVPVLEEGFDMTIVEAMASGLVCVCSQGDGTTELIQEGYNGFVVQKENEEQLAEVLDDILKNYGFERIATIRKNAVISSEKYAIKRQSVNNNLNERHELIYVGRLIKEKGVQTIIEAMDKMPEQFHLTVIGDGPYRDTLEKMNIYSDGRISFLGSRLAVEQYLNKADFFVHMPECEEGFGITVVEAMAAGKICVVADSGAMSEIINNKVDGFIIERNSQALAETICEISRQSQDYLADISMKAREKAQQFSIDKYAEVLDNLISDF